MAFLAALPLGLILLQPAQVITARVFCLGLPQEACAGTAQGPLDTDVEREYCEGQFSTFLPVLLFFTLSSWPGSSRLNVALL
jgi:hypothetical protein